MAFNKDAKHHFLPGGHIEMGEGAREALMREMMEETGEVVTIGDFVGAVENKWVTDGKDHQEINLVFEMVLGKEGFDIESKEDYLGFSWQSVESLKSINFLPKPMIALIEHSLSRVSASYFGSSISN